MPTFKQLLGGAPLTDTCALSAYLEVRHNPSLGVTLLGAGIAQSVCPSLRILGTVLILPSRHHHLYQESCWSSLSWPLHHPPFPLSLEGTCHTEVPTPSGMPKLLTESSKPYAVQDGQPHRTVPTCSLYLTTQANKSLSSACSQDNNSFSLSYPFHLLTLRTSL